jgi:hypothetical protein
MDEDKCENIGAIRITRLYIATKMRGLTYDEVVKKLDKIALKLEYIPGSFEYVNLLSEDEAAGLTPVECLGESIKRLAHADKVIIEKYEETRSVSCEEYICNKYKIPYEKVFIEE